MGTCKGGPFYPYATTLDLEDFLVAGQRRLVILSS